MPNGRCPTQPPGRCGIHPEGGLFGTNGCTGVTGSDSSALRDAINNAAPTPSDPIFVIVLP